MDKRAALKAAVAVVALLIRILILAGLVFLVLRAFDGRIWAVVVLVVILVGVVGYGFYDTFKD